jgi:DNA-binding MarR family transcriptional regulator
MSDLLFIPAWLDDYGLNPAQFRIVCHVARRGACGDSIQTISQICRMDPQTVKRAIRDLIDDGILVRVSGQVLPSVAPESFALN